MSKTRNYIAMSACLRVGGPMKDRRAPRGGASNDTMDYLREYYCEQISDDENSEDLKQTLNHSS